MNKWLQRAHVPEKMTKYRSKRTQAKELPQTNLPTDDVENINSTNKGRDLLLTNKPRIILWGTEKMPQRIQRYSRVTLHISTHPKQEQDQTEKSSYGLVWLQKSIRYSPTKLENKLPQIYKISDEVINFIEKTMITWWVELSAGGKRLAVAKSQRGIFQGDSLSPLLYIIAMMPLNHLLRKCASRYKLSTSLEKTNRLMYMNGIKLFAKNEKELETLIHVLQYTVRT